MSIGCVERCVIESVVRTHWEGVLIGYIMTWSK